MDIRNAVDWCVRHKADVTWEDWSERCCEGNGHRPLYACCLEFDFVGGSLTICMPTLEEAVEQAERALRALGIENPLSGD